MSRLLLLVVLALVLPVTLPAQEAKPATAKQLKDAVDWSKMPKLASAKKVQTFFAQQTYEATGTFQEAADFYRKELPNLGWKEDKSVDPTADQKTYLSLFFLKDGMGLQVSGYRSMPSDARMPVTLTLQGNVQCDKFPRASDAQIHNASRNSVYYYSKLPAKELVDFSRKFMKEAGWKEAQEDMYEKWAKEGRHVLKFVQNAMQFGVVIAPDQQKKDVLSVSYYAHVQHDLKPEEVATTTSEKKALPKAATMKEAIEVIDLGKFPRVAGAEPRRGDKQVVAIPIATSYQTKENLDDVVKFYQDGLSEKGWKEQEGAIITDNLAIICFEKQEFLLKMTVTKEKEKTQVSVLNLGNIDLRLLPYPAEAKIPSYRTYHINSSTSLNMKDAFAFYRKELTALGWKEVSKSDYTMEFAQNNVRLNYELQPGSNKKTSIKVSTEME